MSPSAESPSAESPSAESPSAESRSAGPNPPTPNTPARTRRRRGIGAGLVLFAVLACGAAMIDTVYPLTSWSGWPLAYLPIVSGLVWMLFCRTAPTRSFLRALSVPTFVFVVMTVTAVGIPDRIAWRLSGDALNAAAADCAPSDSRHRVGLLAVDRVTERDGICLFALPELYANVGLAYVPDDHQLPEPPPRAEPDPRKPEQARRGGLAGRWSVESDVAYLDLGDHWYRYVELPDVS